MQRYNGKIAHKIFKQSTVTSTFYQCGGVVAQSVERATPGEEVRGSIPAMVAPSLLVGSVSV